MKKYPEAYAAYEKVNQSSIASAATFYSAAKTKQLIEGTDMNEVIALMDSAVARFTNLIHRKRLLISMNGQR